MNHRESGAKSAALKAASTTSQNRKRVEMRRGFTLVELLVVIVLIAILMAILLPVLAAARLASHEAKCLANLRSISQLVSIYQSFSRQYPADWKSLELLVTDQDGNIVEVSPSLVCPFDPFPILPFKLSYIWFDPTETYGASLRNLDQYRDSEDWPWVIAGDTPSDRNNPQGSAPPTFYRHGARPTDRIGASYTPDAASLWYRTWRNKALFDGSARSRTGPLS